MDRQERISAVIFDMDGVLVDSELHWKRLEGFFLQSLVPQWTPSDQGKIIGLSVHDLYDMLVRDYGVLQSKEEFLALYNEMARRIYLERVSLLPVFPEYLVELRAHDVPVALTSSSPMGWINMVLDRFNLRALFRVVVSSDELDGAGKPAPDIYILTAQKLDVPPGECVVIEDSENGALSANRAGMICLGIRNGFNDEQDLSAAHAVFASAEEVVERVRDLLRLDAT